MRTDAGGVDTVSERADNTDSLAEDNTSDSRPTQMSDFLVWQPSIFLSISDKIESIGQRDCPAIILGEPGTAKESVARQLHANSNRASGTFVPANCRVLRGQILESQLFGRVAKSGENPGTVSLGAFRAADGGTLFLDEIDKLSLDLQHKLLRILRERSVHPIGSTNAYPVDVRLICATTIDLRQVVQQGGFLPDLYFSLNVATLELPPLRQRREDIVILAKYFLELHAKTYDEPPKRLLPSAIRLLTDYNWPGNIRELANVMERAFVNSRSEEINASELPDEILTTDVLPDKPEQFPPLDEVNKKLVIRALEKTQGQKMAAAKLLKIDHRKLNRLIRKFDLEVSDYKS